MNKINIFILLSLIGLSLAENPFVNLREALEFIQDKKSPEKRFFYSGKEQRREAKENYEEKCERKFINAALDKPRWCPELETWPEWNMVSRKDGHKLKNKHPNSMIRPNQPGFPPGFTPYQFPPNNANDKNNFNINNYPFNQNGNIQFNNQFKPNQPNFPFKN
ncbi:unnamed protein product [Brachionus calyciflorus]|uniref:Uncharacterized protein n=1 Tax=Brachionus calyciflorus TaxID=104777 RepID=A0A813YY46_9BILA|nr:unnamed protein product [Brachionus calyciflorus]